LVAKRRSERANTKGSTGMMHGLKMVKTPPKNTANTSNMTTSRRIPYPVRPDRQANHFINQTRMAQPRPGTLAGRPSPGALKSVGNGASDGDAYPWGLMD
jgi:hypothetical protein